MVEWWRPRRRAVGGVLEGNGAGLGSYRVRRILPHRKMKIRGVLWCFLAALVLCVITTPSGRAHGKPSGGYELTSVRDLADGRGLVASLHLVDNVVEQYGPDIQELRLTVLYETDDRLRVHITDSSHSRWEIPNSLLPRENDDFSILTLSPESYAPENGVHAFGSALEFSYISHPFGFAVTRQSTGEVLFNCTPSYSTDGSPLFNSLVFKDQFLELSTQLPEKSVLFGLGESTRPEGLRLVEGRTYTLWAADVGSNNLDIDLYGSFPFYMELKKGVAHGVLLVNSNGMDVLYGPDHLTYRVIGGVFDFYFFAGPSPLAVVDQYTQLAGRPAPMPYWALGFHQCRWGYKNVEDLAGVVAGYAKAEIPLEVMWSDIDYMDTYKDFTLDAVNYPEDKLRAFVENLHANDQKYVLIVDPGIPVASNYTPYQKGLEMDVFVKNRDGDPYVAQVWPGVVRYPDYLHPDIYEFWGTEIELFHKKIPFDGIWIDMNEASNFCTGPSCHVSPNITCPLKEDFTICCLVCDTTAPLSTWDNPPYKINVMASHTDINTKTIAMSSQHYGGVKEYDAHNLYGLSQAIVTSKAMTKLSGKRPFILSRSTFVGSGAYVAHWTGDNQATWGDLAYSIVSTLNSGLVGLPMVGADICGFQSDTWEELCNRWIQVGSFYPFSRDHSEMHAIRQELYLWDSVAESARVALGARYQLLPYYYTLIFEAHSTGAPVIRPLFFEYTDDPAALEINAQFLVGSAVLVSPVITSGETTVNAYFPKGTWYSIFDFSENFTSAGEFHVLPAPLEKVNVHLRQGSIVPMQGKALTTAAARKTPFTLVVVFSPEDSADHASGRLFLDDGESIDMKAEGEQGTLVEFSAFKNSGEGALHALVTAGEFALKEKYVLQTVKILGLGTPPSIVRINRVSAHPMVHVQANSQQSVEFSHLTLPLGNSFELSWECSEVASS